MRTSLIERTAAMALVGLAGSAVAAEFHILPGASNWCTEASYAEGRIPGSGDVIFIGPGTNVTLRASDKPSWEKIHEVARIVPLGPGSRLSVHVEAGSAEITKAFTAYGHVQSSLADIQSCGCLVKTGDGELLLSGWNSLPATGSSIDYLCGFSVEGGQLTFAPKDSFSSQILIGRIDVAAGATLNVPYCTGNRNAVFASYGLNGKGTIANLGTTPVYLRTMGNGRAPASFGGKVTGPFFRGVLDGGHQSFTGDTSDATGLFELWTSYLGVETFGAPETASSLGKIKALNFCDAGVLEYLGNGTADDPDDAGKGISFNLKAGVSATISAGAGGVRFTGDWTNKDADVPHQDVILSGTNVVTPAYLANAWPAPWSGAAGSAQNLTVTKKGRGLWRLQPAKGRCNAGITYVREGTLQFDDAEEAGRMSAMGLATNLCDRATGVRVTHAIELGSTEESPAAEAVLEYTGNRGVAVSTRPIGLVGKGGHFRNNSTAAIVRWAGASATEAGASPVLTLDGSSTRTNEMADVTDGVGTLSVRKDGPGTWRLSGDLTFSGMLDVQQGRLLVRRIEPTGYDWYRWTIRGLKGGNDYSSNIYIEEWGLFDGNGIRQNLSPSVQGVSYAELKPGEAAFGTTRTVVLPNGDDSLKHMFDALTTAKGRYVALAPGYTEDSGHASWMTPWAAHPETALSVVQRLATGAQAASSWDYMPVWGGAAAPDRMTLEASVDGLHWETLDVVDPETATLHIESSGNNSQTWAFGGVSAKDNVGSASKAYSSGRPLGEQSSTRAYAVFPTGASPTVFVAPGAELEAESTGIVLTKLAVTPAGMGTVKGFDLAASGTIDIILDAELEPGRIPFAFSETATADNLRGWTVTINGAPSSRYVLEPSADGIAVSKLGLLLMVR